MNPRLVLVALAAVACGVSAAAARRDFVAPVAASEAYSRALQVLNDFGYTVLDADRDAGFIRAERKSSGTGTELLTGTSYFWTITVTMAADSSGGTRYVIQPQNVKEERGRRSTFGMRLTGAQQAQVDSMVARLTREPRFPPSWLTASVVTPRYHASK